MEFVVSLLSVVSPSKGNVAVYRGQSATAATAAASVIPAVGSNMAVVHHLCWTPKLRLATPFSMDHLTE